MERDAQNPGNAPKHVGRSPEDADPPGKIGKVPTTPGSGGGIAEAGAPGPGPGARPSGGAKDPSVSHDVPPSASQ